MQLESIEHYLKGRGAVVFNGTERATHPVLKHFNGEIYRLPIANAEFPEVLLVLPSSFPCEPPEVYLPSWHSRRIIPHVDRRGHICTLPTGIAINPTRPTDVIKCVVRNAERLLLRTYTEAELAKEIQGEVYAYWSEGAETIVLSSQKIVAGSWFALESDQVAKSLLHARIQATQSLVRPCVMIDIELPTPQAAFDSCAVIQEVRNSPVFNEAIRALPKFCTACRTHLPQRFLLHFVLRARISGQAYYFALKLKSGLPSMLRRRSFSRLHSQVLEGFRSYERICVQDRSTQRLLRRDEGSLKESLTEERIGLIGCGSLGGFLADFMARSGIGHFFLVDKEALEVPNLSRHLLTSRFLDQSKSASLASFLNERFVDLEVDHVAGNIGEREVVRRLIAWEPTLILTTTGDNNTDFGLSGLVRDRQYPTTGFAWVEPRVLAGHLALQPSGGTTFRELHEITPDGLCLYKHRMIRNPSAADLQEPGCQSRHTPYSALQVINFASALTDFICSRILGKSFDQTMAWRWAPQETGAWEKANHDVSS